MSQEGAQGALFAHQLPENQSSQTPPTQDYVALSLDDKDEPESPPTTSLFLCPSNLGALLETATSLSLGVASGEVGDKGPSTNRERDRGVCEGWRDTTATLRGQESQTRCVKHPLH